MQPEKYLVAFCNNFKKHCITYLKNNFNSLIFDEIEETQEAAVEAN